MTDARRVALVATTAGYVGPDLARSLAARGHDLVIGDPVEGLVDELTGLGATVEVVAGVHNLASPEAAIALVEAAVSRFGRIDSAVAATGRIVIGRFLKSSVEDLRAAVVGCLEAPYNFLRAVVPHFMADPKVGMVQARWGHMNRGHSILTRTQALMLDGHHLVENRARAAAGWLFNFSGTGGMWRKAAIAGAGGWQHDTLTEDLDLSYRAQLAGWRFVYRENIVTPAELPEDISAFRAQQFRWAKGTVQTARKLLSRILRSELSLMQRIEAFFHMTPHFAYPLMVILSVLLLPALVLMPATDPTTMLMIDLPLVIGTTGSLAAFYAMAEVAQGRRRIDALKQLPALLALGAGLAPHLTKAVWEGLRSMSGEFVRTPKKGTLEGRYHAAADLPMIEIALSLTSGASVVASVETGHWFATPFAMLFTFGYGYVAFFVASEQLARRKAQLARPLGSPASSSMPPPAPAVRGQVAAVGGAGGVGEVGGDELAA